MVGERIINKFRKQKPGFRKTHINFRKPGAMDPPRQVNQLTLFG